MNAEKTLQLDYPVWRLSFSEYDLSQTEATCQWYDERAYDGEDIEEWQRRSEQEGE